MKRYLKNILNGLCCYPGYLPHYTCDDRRVERSIFCDYHKWLVGVVVSQLGTCVVLLASIYLSSLYPSKEALICLFGLAIGGVWVYTSIRK